jgi:large subunit ribosomal protein L4
MARIEVRDAQGAVVGERELPAGLFDAEISIPMMHQVVVAGFASRRAGTHSTKTRGEVSGGGRKPWRQKGTGRARHGSTRSPIWSGGGVAHGPKPRDYTVRVNRKMRRAALRSALTDAAVSGKLAVVEGLTFEGPSTKDADAVLTSLDLGGRVLVVIPGPDRTVELSYRNLARVKVAYPGNLSTYDLLYADRVLFTADALDALAARAQETPGRSREEPDSGEAAGEEQTGVTEGTPGPEEPTDVPGETETAAEPTTSEDPDTGPGASPGREDDAGEVEP